MVNHVRDRFVIDYTIPLQLISRDNDYWITRNMVDELMHKVLGLGSWVLDNLGLGQPGSWVLGLGSWTTWVLGLGSWTTWVLGLGSWTTWVLDNLGLGSWVLSDSMDLYHAMLLLPR